MRIHIIRHGMTEANRKRLYCGATDLPLCEEGRRELGSLKAQIVYPAADAYISSGMARASETLRIIYGREPDAVIGEFREMDFGDFEMKSHDELAGAPEYERWLGDISGVACPNGESLADFESRIAAGIQKLTEAVWESAVVICHGGVVVSIMERLFPGRRNYYEWQPGNGRGYTVELASGNAELTGTGLTGAKINGAGPIGARLIAEI